MPNLAVPQRLELYRLLRLNRTVEERLVRLYRQGKVVGGLYRCLGQEATSVGSAYALSKGDIIGPLIRNLGAVLAAGFTPRDVFAQHMGRASSPTGGKDGNLHFGTPEAGMVAPSSMLGSLVSVMAGIALGATMRKTRAIAMTWIGDGAMSTGAFHEGFNFACVQRLPLVVIAENNGWAYSTPLSKQTRARSLAERASGYGAPVERVDGNDVLAVYETASRAVARAREAEGPTLIEAVTYRMKGHAEHDGQDYVPAEALAEWGLRDPIALYTRHLLEQRDATAETLESIDRAVVEQVDAELEAAEAAPMPAPRDALKGVYAGETAEAEPVIIRRLL
jgi:pyruvate dehydrogenase E1 component alpha subunit/2-oxoisovalerate dehydrogenase E1 component alpha subunit